MHIKDCKERKAKAKDLIKKVGMTPFINNKGSKLSGGQKQRTVIARALAKESPIILADEPTGALDSHSSDELLQLFEDINKQGQTILMVTHSTKAASSAKRVLFIKDGRVFHQLYRGTSTKQEMYQKISDTLTMIATGGVKNE